jgi:hypothetical protein
VPDETLSGESSGFSPDPSAELDLGRPPRAEPGARRYRKRPVVVEAVRLTEDNAVAVADWVSDHGTHCDQFPERLLIGTLEGEMSAPLGWWVIRGVAGEFYPCEPKIFEASYEPATDDGGPVLTRRIALTARCGGPLEVTPEAAEALTEAGLFVGSAEDARIVLSAPVPAGTFSDEVIAAAERLAQAAGMVVDGAERHQDAPEDAGPVSVDPEAGKTALRDAADTERES